MAFDFIWFMQQGHTWKIACMVIINYTKNRQRSVHIAWSPGIKKYTVKFPGEAYLSPRRSMCFSCTGWFSEATCGDSPTIWLSKLRISQISYPAVYSHPWSACISSSLVVITRSINQSATHCRAAPSDCRRRATSWIAASRQQADVSRRQTAACVWVN